MTSKKIRVPGWRVERGFDRITFDRGDYRCVVNICNVVKFGKEEDSYKTEATATVLGLIYDGAPIRRYSNTFRAMRDAVIEAAKAFIEFAKRMEQKTKDKH